MENALDQLRQDINKLLRIPILENKNLLKIEEIFNGTKLTLNYTDNSNQFSYLFLDLRNIRDLILDELAPHDQAKEYVESNKENKEITLGDKIECAFSSYNSKDFIDDINHLKNLLKESNRYIHRGYISRSEDITEVMNLYKKGIEKLNEFINRLLFDYEKITQIITDRVNDLVSFDYISELVSHEIPLYIDYIFIDDVQLVEKNKNRLKYMIHISPAAEIDIKHEPDVHIPIEMSVIVECYFNFNNPNELEDFKIIKNEIVNFYD